MPMLLTRCALECSESESESQADWGFAKIDDEFERARARKQFINWIMA